MLKRSDSDNKKTKEELLIEAKGQDKVLLHEELCERCYK